MRIIPHTEVLPSFLVIQSFCVTHLSVEEATCDMFHPKSNFYLIAFVNLKLLFELALSDFDLQLKNGDYKQ